MTFDIGKAISYPFQDDEWIPSFAITIVLGIIPIIGWFFIAGYMLRIVKAVIKGDEKLPKYDDWGGDFTRGLMGTIGGIIYYAPILLVVCCTSVAFDDSTIIQCCAVVFYFGYGLVSMPLISSALARYAVSEDFNAFLDIGGRFKDLTDHLSDAIILWLIYVGFSIVLPIVATIGFIFCIIPGLIVIAAGYFMQAHIVGQWGKIIGAGGAMTAPDFTA